MNLIGDVKGKVAVLVDDMIDTAGTITNAAKVSLIGAFIILSLLFGAPDLPDTVRHQSHLVSPQPTSHFASWCFVHVVSKVMQSAVYLLGVYTDVYYIAWQVHALSAQCISVELQSC